MGDTLTGSPRRFFGDRFNQRRDVLSMKRNRDSSAISGLPMAAVALVGSERKSRACMRSEPHEMTP